MNAAILRCKCKCINPSSSSSSSSSSAFAFFWLFVVYRRRRSSSAFVGWLRALSSHSLCLLCALVALRRWSLEVPIIIIFHYCCILALNKNGLSGSENSIEASMYCTVLVSLALARITDVAPAPAHPSPPRSFVIALGCALALAGSGVWGLGGREEPASHPLK